MQDKKTLATRLVSKTVSLWRPQKLLMILLMASLLSLPAPAGELSTMVGAVAEMSDIHSSSETALSQIGYSFKSFTHTDGDNDQKWYRITLPEPKTIVEALVVHECS